jgi:hypothetical protein
MCIGQVQSHCWRLCRRVSILAEQVASKMIPWTALFWSRKSSNFGRLFCIGMAIPPHSKLVPLPPSTWHFDISKCSYIHLKANSTPPILQVNETIGENSLCKNSNLPTQDSRFSFHCNYNRIVNNIFQWQTWCTCAMAHSFWMKLNWECAMSSTAPLKRLILTIKFHWL